MLAANVQFPLRSPFTFDKEVFKILQVASNVGGDAGWYDAFVKLGLKAAASEPHSIVNCSIGAAFVSMTTASMLRDSAEAFTPNQREMLQRAYSDAKKAQKVAESFSAAERAACKQDESSARMFFYSYNIPPICFYAPLDPHRIGAALDTRRRELAACEEMLKLLRPMQAIDFDTVEPYDPNYL